MWGEMEERECGEREKEKRTVKGWKRSCSEVVLVLKMSITAASIATLEINKILTLSPSARTFRAIGIIPQNLGAMMDFIKWSTNIWRLVFLRTRVLNNGLNQMDFRGCHYELEHGRGCTFVHAPRVAAEEYHRTGAEPNGRQLMMVWKVFCNGWTRQVLGYWQLIMGLVLSRKSLAELYQLRASWNIFEGQSSWWAK